MIVVRNQYQFSTPYRRQENQDRCFWIASQSRTGGYRDLVVYAVCDGISNANGGKAAEWAVQSLYGSLGEMAGELGRLSGVPTGPDAEIGDVLTAQEEEHWLQGCLTRAILTADAFLRTKIECGTTISLAAVFNEHVYTANVGDSPVFLLKWEGRQPAKLEELYTCHNKAGALVREGKMERDEALRSPYKNHLELAVGVGIKLNAENISHRSAALAEHNILLLGSDGALSVFPARRLEEIARGAAAEDMRFLSEAVFEGVKDVEEATDNFTLIASRIDLK